jgi:hypothetical protein
MSVKRRLLGGWAVRMEVAQNHACHMAGFVVSDVESSGSSMRASVS